MGVVASSVDGVPVAFDVRGTDEPTLVFIHGLAGDRSDFDGQMSYLAESFQVVAVDLPGSGESGRARTMWTMAAFGEDVVSVADQLGLDDMVLVGHSLGGDVTVEAALRLGGRVRGLIWVSSYRSLGTPMSSEQMEEWLAPFRTNFVSATQDLARRNFGPHADPDLVERVTAKMAAADPERVVELLIAWRLNEPALLRGLREVAVPVVAINPDFKPNDQASFDSHGVELKVMSDVGHFAMMENPDEFNDLLADTISNLRPPA